LKTTQGFDAHFEELKAFRIEREKMEQETYREKLKERALKLGIPNRLKLVEYIEDLEYQMNYTLTNE